MFSSRVAENFVFPLISLSFLFAFLVFINFISTSVYAPGSCTVAAYTISNFNWTNSSAYNGSTVRFFADFQYGVGTIGASEPTNVYFLVNNSNFSMTYYNSTLYSSNTINSTVYVYNYTDMQAGTWNYWFDGWKYTCSPAVHSSSSNFTLVIASAGGGGNQPPAFQWQQTNTTNGSVYVDGATTQIFASFTDDNGTTSIIMTFNGTNYTMAKWNGTDNTSGTWNYNFTGLTNGTYFYNFSAYDGANASLSSTFELVLSNPVARSKGLATYYGKNGSFTTFDPLVFRYWSSSTANWTGENATSNLSSTNDQWTVLKCDRNQTNCIMGTLITNGTVQAQAYTGDAWGAVQTIAPNIGSTNSQARGFDVAFEYARGWGIVISGNNTSYPYYDLWYPNNTWSGVKQFPSSTCGGTPLWVEAASKPNSNEIIVAYENSTGTCAYVWDGSNWGNPQGVNTGTANLTQKSFCVAYEMNSGHAELFYDNQRSGILDYANWTGSTWQVSNVCNPVCAASGNYVWFSCASMPNSNRILWASPLQPTGGAQGAAAGTLSFEPFCSAWDYFTDAACRVSVNVHSPSRLHYATAQLDAREWNQGWGTLSSFASTVEGDLTDRQMVDVAYIGGSGWGQMVYSPDGNFPKERRCMGATGCSNGTTGWTTARDTTATICGLAGTGSNQTDLIRLVSDSATNDTMLLYSTQSSTEPICGQLYDGNTNTWGTVNALEDTNRVLPNTRPFDFTFYNTSTSQPPQYWWTSFNVTNRSIANTTIPLTAQFFANWSDDSGVSQVIMTFNSSNYSMSLWNGTSTNGVWNYNLSNLTGMPNALLYVFNFTATDGSRANTSGNTNLNLTAPSNNVSFVDPTPANGTSFSSNSIYVNVSSASNALYNHSVFLDWNYSLVGWWPMDFYNSTIVYDNSTYANNASYYYNLGPSNITTGARGLGLRFPGNNSFLRVETNNSAYRSFNQTGFTVSGWVNGQGSCYGSNTTATKSNYCTVFARNENACSASGWILAMTDTQYRFQYGGSSIFAGGLSNNTWQHVAVTWNGTNFSVWVNGNVKGSAAVSSWPENQNTNATCLAFPMTIGARFGGLGISSSSNYFNGSIDEVMIFNRSLSRAEMLALYNASATQYERNFTSLSNGTYYTKAWSIDSGGAINSTELRQFTISHPAPNVSFVDPTPANGSATGNNWINVSVSSAANSSQHSVFNDWNQSLLGWWSFDFNNRSGVYDNSTYGNNATFQSGINLSNLEEGPRGLGLTFDGSNDYLNTSIYDNVRLSSTGLTVMFWFRTNVAGGSGNRRFFAKAINSTDSFMLTLVGGTTNNLAWMLAAGGSNYNRTSSININNNTWYHVAVVWNGTNSSMYINGVGKSGSTAGGLTQTTTFTPLIIGGDSTGGSNFNGTIDELQIYNRTLTEAEINASYNAQTYQYYNNFTSLVVPATYTSQAWAIDREGAFNTTGLYTFNTNLAPQFWWAAFNYTNGTNWNSANPLTVQFFVNVSDDGAVSQVNMTFNGTNYTMVLWNGTSANGVWNYNLTGLTNGLHLFNFTATDGLNANTSSNYNLNLVVSGMNVSFVSPTPNNGTLQAGNYTYVNVSSSSTDAEHSVFLDWNYSLVGWWGFDHYNSTVAFDNSSYGNNGTFAGGMGTSTQVSGARGYAQSFDGSTQYIDAGNRSSLAIGSTGWTVALWFYSGSIKNTTNMRLVENIVDGRNGYVISIDNSSGRLVVKETKAGTTQNYVSSSTFSNNTWYHIAVVWPGNGAPVAYINGTSSSGFLGSPPTLGTTPGFSIGRTPGSSNFFKGYLDEVMVFNRPLNQSEIGAIWRGNATNQSSRNYTGLTQGNYSFRAWAINSYGLINSTELRTVQIPDAPPGISFVDPTPVNNANLTVNYSYVNISSNDVDSVRHSVYVDFNNTLLGWWSMDSFNNSVIYDNSTYNTSAYFQNGLGTQNLNSSARGKGLAFDGSDDYLNLTPSYSLVQGNNSFSIAFWVNLLAAGSFPRVFTKIDGDPAYGSRITFDSSNNVFTFDTMNNWANTSTAYDCAAITSSRWYYLVFTYNASTQDQNIFLDGTNQTCYTAGSGITAAEDVASSFRIGLNLVGSNALNGTLDEFQLYNRTLTPAEVNASYNATQYQYARNFTDLPRSNYTVRAWSIDQAGNMNATELRPFSVIAPLNINFVAPTPQNGTTQASTNNSIYVNVSSNALMPPHSVFLDWNSSLVGWWDMDAYNNTGVYDNSTYGNNASFSITNPNVTVNNITAGVRGNAVALSGNNSYLYAPNSPSLNLNSSNLSVFLWVKGQGSCYETNSTSTKSNYCPMIAKMKMYAGGTRSCGWVFVQRDTVYRLQFYDCELPTSSNLDVSAGTPNNNTWTFMGFVWNGTHVRMYKNGVAFSYTAFTVGWNDSADVLKIGGRNDVQCTSSNCNSYNGSIDEVLIFNRSLSQAEINALYNASENQYAQNFTNLGAGSYYAKAYGVDSGGLVNSTETRLITINASTALPAFQWASFNITNGSMRNTTIPFTLQVFASFTATNAITEVNMTFNGTNYTMVLWNGTSTNGVWNYNFTDLNAGLHVLNFTATDGSNANTSQLFNYNLIASSLNISFVSPTSPDPTNLTTINYFYANVSSATNMPAHSVFLDFNKSLVGWWSMDFYNSTHVFDNSTYANNGSFATQSAGTSFDPSNVTAGTRGLGLNFTQGTYVSIPDSATLDTGNNLTFMAWVRPININVRNTVWGNNNAANAWQIEVGAGNGGTPGARLTVIVNGIWIAETENGGLVPANTWTNIAYTRNGTGPGTHTLYVNGVVQALRIDNATNFSDASTAREIGRRSSTQQWFNGSLDDLLVFNRPLSAAEINAVYNATASQYAQNFSVTSDGNYTYRAWASDSAGNFNSTELRHIEVYSGCQDITSATGFTLSRNASLIAGMGRTVCFDFKSNGLGGLYLDCNNFNVTDYTNSGTGIRSLGFSYQIRNCPLYNFTTHVSISNGSFPVISNVNATYGTTGFFLNGTANIGYANSLVNVNLNNMTNGIIINGAVNRSTFTKVNLNYVTNAITQNYTSLIDSYNNYTNVSIFNATTGINLTSSNSTRLADVYFTQTTTHYSILDSRNIYALGGNADFVNRFSISSSNFTQAYYSQLNVTYCANSSAVEGATAYFDSTSGIQFDSSTTDALGLSGWRNITSYYVDCTVGDCSVGSPTVNYTPHKFYGNLSGYINDTATVYLSQNTTASACLNVGATIDATLVNYTVDFSTVNVGNDYYSHNASGLFNRSFTLNNTGTAKVNITITASNPFTSNKTSMPDTWYRYNVTESSSGTLSRCELQNPGNWYAVNLTGQSGVLNGICQLNTSTSGAGMAVIAINLNVPSDEPAGVKSSTVIFTSSQS